MVSKTKAPSQATPLGHRFCVLYGPSALFGVHPLRRIKLIGCTIFARLRRRSLRSSKETSHRPWKCSTRTKGISSRSSALVAWFPPQIVRVYTVSSATRKSRETQSTLPDRAHPTLDQQPRRPTNIVACRSPSTRHTSGFSVHAHATPHLRVFFPIQSPSVSVRSPRGEFGA